MRRPTAKASSRGRSSRRLIRQRGSAVTAAEKLRVVIAAIDVPGVPRAITASFGIATMPADGATSPRRTGGIAWKRLPRNASAAPEAAGDAVH